MLNIYLDTDLLCRLSRELYPEKLAELRRLKSEGKLSIYFTALNLHELIYRVEGEEQFDECKNSLRFIGDFCSDYVLEDNWERMRRAVAHFWGMSLPKLTIDWVKMVSLVPEAKSYDEVKDNVGFLRDYLEGFKQDWLESAGDTRNRIKKALGLEKLPGPEDPILSLLSHESSSDLIRQQLWETCKIHHRLPSYANRLGHVVAYEKIAPVRYFIDIQRTYQEMMFRQGTTPDVSDYFNIGHVIYLDLLDYFLTNNKKLKELYDSASDELGNACIMLDEVSELEYLSPRAPQRGRFEKMLLAMQKQ
jgi:hypothetical protein